MLRELVQGHTLIIDKPLGWTSFEVVNKIRYHLRKRLNVKKIKVGHAGTLDPLATGVLVICIGKHTKTINELMAGEKEYTGKILLGKQTPSYDLESEFIESVETNAVTPESVEQIIPGFIGKIEQIPPTFSAKQIDGKRAYELARSGEALEMKATNVEIFDLDINTDHLPILSFKVRCSKGTYIRSLAHDIGQSLGVGGTLIQLRREASGAQHILEAKTVKEVIDFIDSAPLD
jgi:tRNA pseudouridine55 synthase